MTKDRDLEQAISHFREALRLDPNHLASRYYPANCLASLGRRQDALDELLRLAADARGEDQRQEGDIASRMHRESTPLSTYWQSWDGSPEPASAFGEILALLDR